MKHRKSKKRGAHEWPVMKSNQGSKTKKTGEALAPNPVLWPAGPVFTERALFEVGT